jgi:predicted NAD/FAD-binding protein
MTGTKDQRWYHLSGRHWLTLLALLALAAIVLAWISFGLINLAMANAAFLARHGLLAIREGGLWQTVEIGGRAFLAMLAYLAFKALETEIIHRWRGLDR